MSRRRRTRARSGIVVAAACTVCLAGSQLARGDDLTTIAQRVTSQLLSSSPSLSTVQGYMSSLQANGSWTDIDYGSTAATNWSPGTHLQRMEAMAQLYASPGSS